MFEKLSRRWRKWSTIWKHRRFISEAVEWHAFFLANRDVSVWGGVSEDDHRGLREAVARAASFEGPIVEIGTLFGWTTQLLASLKSPEKELIAVENFCWNPFCVPPDDHRVITRRTLHYCLEHCRTRIFDGSSREFYDTYAGRAPSMAFIDGDHSDQGVQADIRWAREQGVAVIAGHDYNARLHQPIVRAVEENFGSDIQVFGTVWIAGGESRQARPRLAA